MVVFYSIVVFLILVAGKNNAVQEKIVLEEEHCEGIPITF